MANIHSSSIVDSSAQLDDSVIVGPFCLVGPKVKIGANTELLSHVRIDGPTEIGTGNKIFPFSYIGSDPQDKKYAGEESFLIIGNNNIIRENSSIHRGTTGGGNVTRIGDSNLIMEFVHIAHDVIIKNNTIIANATQIAGHVLVEDFVTIGGVVGVTQYVTLGKHAYVGASSMIAKDIPPFTICNGNPIKPRSINVVGLQRRHFKEESIKELQKAFKILFISKSSIKDAIKRIESECNINDENILELINFINNSEKGIAL